MPSDVGGHEPGPTGGAQKGRSLHTFRSFYVDVIDFILFNSCRSQFLPQSQVSQKKETMPRGQRTRETQHLLTPSASCPSWICGDWFSSSSWKPWSCTPPSKGHSSQLEGTGAKGAPSGVTQRPDGPCPAPWAWGASGRGRWAGVEEVGAGEPESLAPSWHQRREDAG